MKQKRTLKPDTGLSLRMFLSYLILAALYLAFAWVLLHVGIGMAGMVIVAGGLLFVQYYFSDQMVLMATGARIVSDHQEPELHAMVAKLSVLADLPKPRIAVMPTMVPNAFATGRSPKTAVVAVTSGLMQRLDDPELEAVLAHELTHIRNRDMTLMTMASFFATIAGYITQMSLWFGFGFGYGDQQDQEDQLLVYLASLLVWVISFFLIRAISRYREFAADRGSAILTGQPSQLESALIKISGTVGRVPTRDLRQAETLSALFIIPAVRRGSLMELFQTHPSLERRLAYLRRLDEEMNR